MSNDKLQKKAEARVDARIGFYTHAGVYVLVNVLLWGINLATSPDALWAMWPTFGWGIGLVSHGVSVVFGQRDRPTHGLRDRMIQSEVKLLEKDQQQFSSQS